MPPHQAHTHAYTQETDIINNVCMLILPHTQTHRINAPRTQGGLGRIRVPLLSDITKNIAREYGVLLEDKGIALRYSNVNRMVSYDLMCVPFMQGLVS